MNVDVRKETATVYYVTIRDDDGTVVDRFRTLDLKRVERTKRRVNRQ